MTTINTTDTNTTTGTIDMIDPETGEVTSLVLVGEEVTASTTTIKTDIRPGSAPLGFNRIGATINGVVNNVDKLPFHVIIRPSNMIEGQKLQAISMSGFNAGEKSETRNNILAILGATEALDSWVFSENDNGLVQLRTSAWLRGLAADFVGCVHTSWWGAEERKTLILPVPTGRKTSEGVLIDGSRDCVGTFVRPAKTGWYGLSVNSGALHLGNYLMGDGEKGYSVFYPQFFHDALLKLGLGEGFSIRLTYQHRANGTAIRGDGNIVSKAEKLLKRTAMSDEERSEARKAEAANRIAESRIDRAYRAQFSGGEAVRAATLSNGGVAYQSAVVVVDGKEIEPVLNVDGANVTFAQFMNSGLAERTYAVLTKFGKPSPLFQSGFSPRSAGSKLIQQISIIVKWDYKLVTSR